MTSRRQTRRNKGGWIVAAILAIPAAIHLGSSAATLTGYNLRDLQDPEQANTASRAAMSVVRATAWPIPVWTLPASWLVIWGLVKLSTSRRGSPIAPELDDLLERQRETTAVYRELSESRKEWGESLRAERDEFREKMNDEFERMAAGFVALGLELDSTDQVLTLEQRKSRLAGLLLTELAKQSEELAGEIRTDVRQDVDNIKLSYFHVRKELRSFSDPFVAGSMGGDVPISKNYVQRMVYFIGAMTRHFEQLEFKVRRLGLMPGIMWDVYSKHAEFNEEEFKALVEERFNLAHERKVIAFLDSLIEKNERDLLQIDEGQAQ